MRAFVVESPALNNKGEYAGKFQLWTGSEERARTVAAQAPGRTWREVPIDEVPAEARANLERAARG